MAEWNKHVFGGREMKTYLVTGAAGFIGANYLKYILNKHNNIFVVAVSYTHLTLPTNSLV